VSLGVIGLAAVALVAVGVLVGMLVLPEQVPASAVPDAGGGTVAASTQVYDGAKQATATPVVTEERVLRSPASGVVTASGCEPGGVLASGSAAMWVDNQPVVALATSLPMWRDLSSGAKGADVSAVQTELVRLGYHLTVTGVWDWTTRTQVQALWTSLGATSTDGSLARAAQLWLPAPQVAVSACAAQVGDPVAMGQDLVSLAGGLRSMTVANPPGAGYVATFADHAAPLDDQGVITDPDFLASVEASAQYAWAMGPSGQKSVPVTLSLAQPLEVLVVPPSALVPSGGAAAAGCVVAEDGSLIHVTVVSSSLGKTMVSVTDGPALTRVQVRPDSGVTCS